MEKHLTGLWTQSEQSRELIRRLGSCKVEIRRAAQAEFLRMAIDAPSLFHADLTDLIQVIAGQRRQSFRSVWTAAIASLWTVTIYGASHTASTAMPISQPLALLFTFLWTVILLFLIDRVILGIGRRSFDRRNRRLTECITDLDDLNTLPALIELMACVSPSMQNAISPPLTRLLFRIRAADGHLLGSLHRTALANALRTPRTRLQPAAFFVAILQTIERIGDNEALPTVARLAHGRGIASEHPEVHIAAQRCLAHLQELDRRQRAPSLLLRASGIAADSRSLPRPVVVSCDTARHELLRTAETRAQ